MAKGKHSTALFEVIHGNKPFDRRGGAALLTPTWWFKGRRKIEPRPGAAALAADARAGAVEEVDGLSLDAVQEPVLAEEAPAREKHPLGRSAIHWEFDRQHQELTVQLRYTTAVAGGFVLLLIVGCAYVLGRHGGDTPQLASGSLPTTDELRHGPAQPEALDLPRHTDHSAGPAHEIAPPAAPAGHDAPAMHDPAQDVSLPEASAQRSIGLNYVIVQSYPNEKSATEARDYLVKSGIACTTEKGPKDWTADPNWYSVVTLTPVQHIHSAEYEALVARLNKLGDKFAGNAKFKRFEPHPYKWK